MNDAKARGKAAVRNVPNGKLSAAVVVAVAAAAVLALAACDVASHSEKVERYQVRGVVEAVNAEQRQALIDHEAIPGWMPAMVMNFDVPDPAVFARLKPGRRVEFTLQRRGVQFRITAATVLQEAASAGGESAGSSGNFGASLSADAAPESAHPFLLTDQHGQPVSLADFAGKRVLLDFIYTHCPGPCPALTAAHVSLQRMLPPALQNNVHFISITLDPERDTPAALEEYARVRGVDFNNWSFLTGESNTVRELLEAYGVGGGVQDDGEIHHLIITFLINEQGLIARRYFGLEHKAEALLADLARENL